MRVILMRSGLIVRLLLVLAMVVPAAAVPSVRPALACSGPGVPPPAERFAAGSENLSWLTDNGIALLGVVLDETQIETPFQTVYLSNVETVVPLTGDGIGPVVRVGPNGFGNPDCSGGPRLFPGEKVMLFLYPSFGVLGAPGEPADYGDWQSGQFGTPILFDGNEAYYLSWGRFSSQGESTTAEQRFYVGDSEEVLALALATFDATAAEREDAYQFVLGRSAPVEAPPVATEVPATATGVRISPPDTGSGGLVASNR